MTHQLIIPRRFNGPPSSGNGGWTAGALAAHVPAARVCEGWPTIAVSLRRPPPLEEPLSVVGSAPLRLQRGEDLVAEAAPVDGAPEPVAAVSARDARAAQTAYPGLRSHPFPTCFACGPERAEGDGLRIFPGPVSAAGEPTRVAACWTPAGTVHEDFHAYDGQRERASLAVTWAALDCIGGWAGDLAERLMVLGRMTATVDTLPVIGEEHVVVGEHRGAEGRKTFTASTLWDASGRLVARAEHVWIAVDPALFR